MCFSREGLFRALEPPLQRLRVLLRWDSAFLLPPGAAFLGFQGALRLRKL